MVVEVVTPLTLAVHQQEVQRDPHLKKKKRKKVQRQNNVKENLPVITFDSTLYKLFKIDQFQVGQSSPTDIQFCITRDAVQTVRSMINDHRMHYVFMRTQHNCIRPVSRRN